MSKKKKKLSEEHKRKLAESTKRNWENGIYDSDEIREAYRQQGLSTRGSKRTEEQKQKMSDAHIKRHLDPKYKERQRKIQLERWKKDEERNKQSERMLKMHKERPEIRKKISESMKGRKFTIEHLEKLSIAGRNREDIKGENSHFWNGGKHDDQYPDDFSLYLKRKIRKRDKYICQSCGLNMYGSKFGHVHHIDGSKENCDEKNLVLLCITCHNAVHGKNNIINSKISELKNELNTS